MNGETREYESLREEVLQWQRYRFTLLGGASAVVAAILSWLAAQSSDVAWPVAASIVLAFLSVLSFVSLLLGRSNAKVGAYLSVFHESCGWEQRNLKFNRDTPFSWLFRLNAALASTYCGLAVTSLACLACVSKAPSHWIAWVIFGLLVGVFVLVQYFFAFRSYPYEQFVNTWREIRDTESRGQTAR